MNQALATEGEAGSGKSAGSGQKLTPRAGGWVGPLLQLCDLYENDCIFDKFDCSMSGDGKNFCTGTYSNFFR